MTDRPVPFPLLPPVPVNGDPNGDFDALCAAVMDTPGGRWFLQEFARRNRCAEVQAMLAAIERIGAIIARDRVDLADGSARTELISMAKAIAASRAGLPDAEPVAKVLDDLERRIDAMLDRCATSAASGKLEQTPAQLEAPEHSTASGVTGAPAATADIGDARAAGAGNSQGGETSVGPARSAGARVPGPTRPAPTVQALPALVAPATRVPSMWEPDTGLSPTKPNGGRDAIRP